MVNVLYSKTVERFATADLKIIRIGDEQEVEEEATKNEVVVLDEPTQEET